MTEVRRGMEVKKRNGEVKMRRRKEDEKRNGRGGPHLKPPKSEHIFVAVITFPPFLLCRYFYYQLVPYCVCFKVICEISL